MLYKISPFGNTLTYMLGARILWNLPIFSFLKKVSGIHTFFASVIVRYLILSENLYFTNKDSKLVPCPPLASCCLNSNLLSFQFCLRVIWKWYSCNIREIVRDVDSRDTILTSSILENPRTNTLTKTSVAASVKNQNKLINHADDNLLALSSPFLANSQRFHDHVGVSLLQNISFIFTAAHKNSIDFLLFSLGPKLKTKIGLHTTTHHQPPPPHQYLSCYWPDLD